MTVISVENVTKSYRLGQIGGGTLKADASRWWAMLRNKPDPNLKIGEEHLARRMGDQFWALNDVSFEVKQGEVLGIIGRNGAGKSTMLKILSQVTSPTSGQIKIKGRIASLLEVGTGFNPEMTGRENIFLNGAILGMTKAEIRKKFDEIVDFSGVEEFIDTPVKRYSSGMYVRLAFAVAAHLEPEILIVDEVLAVGDAEFQNKCLGKMKDASTGGRTVLFVSHNLAAVANLCSHAVLMNGGRNVMSGEVETVCQAYAEIWQSKTVEQRSGDFLQKLGLMDASGAESKTVPEGEPLRFGCRIRVPEEKCLVSLIVRDIQSSPIYELFESSFSPAGSNGAEVMVQVDAESLPLLPGRYSVDFWLADRMAKRLEIIDRALTFEVVATEKLKAPVGLIGSIKCKSKWRCLGN